MAKLTLETAQTLRLVSADDLCSHCRIDAPDEDEYLEGLLDAAEADAEDYTDRRFLTQTWDQYFDGFNDPLYLRYPPLQSVTSVKYIDTAGVEQTLSTSVYEVGSERGVGVVRRKYDQDWPSTRGHEDVVIVRCKVGYGDDCVDVPDRIRHAVRLHAAHQYRYREGQPMPDGFRRLLSAFVVKEFQVA